jgi:hypothetical protein
MTDSKLARYLLLLLLLPIGLAMCSGDRFRYPCQDPTNWDKDMCKIPYCDVTRTCPEQIFKGQRDPKGLVSTTPVPTPATPAGACK